MKQGITIVTAHALSGFDGESTMLTCE